MSDKTGNATILSDVVRTQIAEHQDFGGVVPELAARAHVVHLDQIIARACKDASRNLRQVDAIAVTAGPGLIGGVLVGLTTAKALCAALNKPLIGINHLEAHALTPRLTNNIQFPYLLLLVSGGHTQFIAVTGIGEYQIWGTTIDDALGEAFDKVAKMLGLDYPGGPQVERLAKNGDKNRFNFPRPLLNRPGLDFSFSGLKTAVRLAAEKIAPLGEQDVADICASFQHTVTAIIAKRSATALERFKQEFSPKNPTLVVAGGVAANKAIAKVLDDVVNRANASLIVPPLNLCTDNAAMVAWAGIERFRLGAFDDFSCPARARWSLSDPDMHILKSRPNSRTKTNP